MKSKLLLVLLSLSALSLPALEYDACDCVASKVYRRRGQVRYDFGPERLGYVTLDGQPILGDAVHPVPVTNLFLSGRAPLEEGRLVFQRAKCPNAQLGELKFECSNGRVLEFWEDAYRITENIAIAKAVNNSELVARYRGQLKAKGITSLQDVIRKCMAHKSLTMVSGQVPTKDGPPRRFNHVNLTSIDHSVFPAPATAYDLSHYQQERLGRGFCVFRGRVDDAMVFICSWRYLPSDPKDIAFNVYCNGTKMNTKPLTTATHVVLPAKRGGEWELEEVKGDFATRVRPVVAEDSEAYFRIPLATLSDGVTPDGENYTYVPDEAGVGDLDGDGEYEIVLKRSPSIAKDNSQDGYTGETMLEAYRLDGRFLWRIALGVNIRSGAHYTQLLVYDLDGDGKAAVCYFDGRHPSFIMSRGYYAKTQIAAYDFKDGKISKRWLFDSSRPGNEDYAGQGFHNLRIGDVDFDGKDEIVFGSMVVDHDGKGMYSTHLGHGDNQHLVQARPDLRGLQSFTCHESMGGGIVLRNAATGRKFWQHRYPFDAGMCVAADFDPTNQNSWIC